MGVGAAQRLYAFPVLKYGADCEVVSTNGLRERVAAELAKAGKQYE